MNDIEARTNEILDELGVTIESTPIAERTGLSLFPDDPKHEMGHFRVDIKASGKPIRIEYSMGSGHRVWRKGTPNSKMPTGLFPNGTKPGDGVPMMGRFGLKPTIARVEFVEKWAEYPAPKAVDVMYAILLDAQAAWDNTFSDWCANVGLSDDSIRAKQAYDQCLDQWHALSAMLGDRMDELIELLREW
jgi:hypothetical protein